MEKLLGTEELSYSTVSEISSDWMTSQHNHIRYSWKKVWDLDNILNLNPSIEKYSGGANGSLIAQFERSWNSIYAQPIRVFDYKGNMLYEYKIKSPSSDLFFHITSSDRLIVLTTKCQLYIYFAGRCVTTKYLAEVEVTAADIWDNGLVFITDKYEVYYAPFFENPTLMRDVRHLALRPTTFRVIPAEYSGNDFPIVFANDCSESVTLITSDDAWQVEMSDQIVTYEFSPNYQMIAFLCQNEDEMSLVITNSDPGAGSLLTVILDSHSKSFLQLSWVGNDFPIITYEDSVNIVISTGEIIEMDTTHYPFSGRSAIFASCESALVFSSGSLFKLKNVNDDFAQVSSSRPIYPPAFLVDAFVARSSDKAMKLKNEDKLEDAMKICLKSALEVDSPNEQRILMLSANFARSYLDMSESIDIFAENAQKLRVCNAFQKELNTLISPLHLYEEVTIADLLMRICNHQRFALAIKVADFLYADKRAIMTEWCCAMAYNIQDDEVALRIIQKKLDESFEINSIATALYNEGRVNLAKQVANLERSTSRVVPFYISCGMWEEAIDAAVRSSDSTLFVEVIDQAIDNNLVEIVTEAVGRDFITYSTMAKMIGQKSILQNEFYGKCEIYYKIIQKYAENYIPENLISYCQALEDSTNKIDAKLAALQKPPLNGETVNHLIEKYVLSCDPKNHKSLSEFHSHFKINKKKFYIMCGTILSSKKKWDKFILLSGDSYSSYWHYYVLMAQYQWGADHAMEFVQNIQDQGQAEKLKNMLLMGPGDQYATFTGMKQVRLFDFQWKIM